jgi:uncharacterized RDD family membrane protein YckC
MKKSKSTPTAPKPASEFKNFLAFALDMAVLFCFITLTFKIFHIERIFPDSTLTLRYVYVALYYYLFLTVLTQAVFSQTFGKFVFGLKVVTKEKYQRLSFVQSLFFSTFLRFLTKSVVVNIR